MNKLSGFADRILFAAAVLLAVLAMAEKLANMSGQTLVFVLRESPARLLEFAAVALLFVIAIQLREMSGAAGGKSQM